MQQVIGIRADANGEVGMGHIMRCITIAKQIKELGHETVFFTADGYANDLLKRAGMESICLDSPWNRINVLETVIHIYEFSYAPYLFKICPCGLIRIHQKLLAPYFPQFLQQPVRFRFHPVPRRIQTDRFHPNRNRLEALAEKNPKIKLLPPLAVITAIALIRYPPTNTRLLLQSAPHPARPSLGATLFSSAPSWPHPLSGFPALL